MKRRSREITTQTDSSLSNGASPTYNIKNLIRVIINVILIVPLIILIANIGYLIYLSQDLPSTTRLENIDPKLATHVYSEDGELIKRFYRINRSFTPFEKFPEDLVNALIATEDRKFYDHWGVDLPGIFRSIIMAITSSRRVRGTSTLTMQLARNLNVGFGSERTTDRKLKEILRSNQISW